MNRVVTHELIHAFDHCRAHVDWFNNFRHLACSEVSPVVLVQVLSSMELSKCLYAPVSDPSGEPERRLRFQQRGCKVQLWFEGASSGTCARTPPVGLWVFFSNGVLLLGQACVRGRALRSILAVRNISPKEAEKIVDEVFDTCFNDHAPFGRIPHSKRDAHFAYRDYENRNRYYANL